jgi:hypothetical protein
MTAQVAGVQSGLFVNILRMARWDVAVQPATAELDSVTTPSSNRDISLLEVGTPDRWNVITGAALVSLFLIWGWQVYSTWGAWGNLTVDSGHEMYIPALLAQGKMLYRDVWFNFGPLAPYFNSYLFRLFGIHLSVLYWAGSFAALGAAVLLYVAGMRLSAWPIGWTAGAVMLIEGFQPSLFCFPLPYSFSALYGCLIACLSLYLFIKAAASSGWGWLLAAGTAAAIALLLKPEFGMACYLMLITLIVVRNLKKKSAKPILQDIAAILPGIVICSATVLWMVSIRGVEFMTQENIDNWPTSFFMKNYASKLLQGNGFSITPASLTDALIRSLFPAACLLELYCVFKWKRRDARATVMKVVLFGGLAIWYKFMQLNPQTALASLVFPRDMVFYVLIAAVLSWWIFWRRKSSNPRDLIIPLILTFSGLQAFRIMFRMMPAEYPIYYNGPVVLCFLLLMLAVIRQNIRTAALVWKIEAVFCVACLASAGLYTHQIRYIAKSFVPLTTDRGTILVSPHMKESYLAAIGFMKEKAALGESVLSVPEDTSLYFLSDTYCPTRVFMFLPGIMAPGKMTAELIQEIESKDVRYLLWSNRLFWEYGAPIFGRDFDQQIGEYFRSHYHRVGLLTPSTGSFADWTVTVWERNNARTKLP